MTIESGLRFSYALGEKTEEAIRAHMNMSLPSARDHRIDFFRGIALLMIIITHMDANPMSMLTINFFWFTGNAPFFYFLSGYVATLVYRKALLAGGLPACFKRTLARSWTLYVWNGATFIVCGTLAWYFHSVYAVPVNGYHFDLLLKQPLEAVLGVLTFTHLPVFFFILPMYIFFLAVMPLFLALMERNWNLALAVTFSIYSIEQVVRALGLPMLPQQMPFFSGSWHYSPLAWQFIFFSGSLLAHKVLAGKVPPWLKSKAAYPAYAGAAFFLLFKWHDLVLKPWGINLLQDPVIWFFFDKDHFGILTLLNFGCLLVVGAHLIPKERIRMENPWLRPIILCGQNSLEIFCLGIVIDYVENLSATAFGYGAWIQVANTFISWAIILLAAKAISVHKGRATREAGSAAQFRPAGSAGTASE